MWNAPFLFWADSDYCADRLAHGADHWLGSSGLWTRDWRFVFANPA